VYSWNPVAAIDSIGDWDDAFTGLHGASRISVADRRAPWAGRLDWQRSRHYGLALCSSGEQQVTRRERHIRSDPRGTYELLVPLAGKAQVEQGPSAAVIGPGQMALCDADRPFQFAHDAGFLSVAFIVPRQDIALRSPAAVREPQVFDGASGLGRVIRRLVITLQEERDQFSEFTFDGACDRLLDLVCMAAEGGAQSAPIGHRESIEVEIRRYVRRHAGESDLDVTGVARALGWSPRYIQQVLQAANTTPRDLIRRERLHLARTRLAGSRSIAQVAASCGFGSHAAFTTAFRREFGLTPTEARQAAKAVPTADR